MTSRYSPPDHRPVWIKRPLDTPKVRRLREAMLACFNRAEPRTVAQAVEDLDAWLAYYYPHCLKHREIVFYVEHKPATEATVSHDGSTYVWARAWSLRNDSGRGDFGKSVSARRRFGEVASVIVEHHPTSPADHDVGVCGACTLRYRSTYGLELKPDEISTIPGYIKPAPAMVPLVTPYLADGWSTGRYVILGNAETPANNHCHCCGVPTPSNSSWCAPCIGIHGATPPPRDPASNDTTCARGWWAQIGEGDAVRSARVTRRRAKRATS